MSDVFIPVAKPWWFTNVGVLVGQGILAARLPRRNVRILFAVSAAFHVGEAAYTYRAARAAGFNGSVTKWTLQTLAVGFPSLFALHRAKRGADICGP
jgi:hypothetical protein